MDYVAQLNQILLAFSFFRFHFVHLDAIAVSAGLDEGGSSPGEVFDEDGHMPGAPLAWTNPAANSLRGGVHHTVLCARRDLSCLQPKRRE